MLTLALLINPSLMWVCTTYLRRLNKKQFLGIIWLWTVIVKKWFRLDFLKDKIFAVCHHNIIEFESEEEKLDPPMYVLLLFHKKNVLSKNYSHSHLYSVIKSWDHWVWWADLNISLDYLKKEVAKYICFLLRIFKIARQT